MFEILRRIELSITLDGLAANHISQNKPGDVANPLNSMTQVAQGVFITDQLFLPRYIWYKMKVDIPLIREKMAYFKEIGDVLKEVRILYNKGAAKIKHLAQMSKVLSELKEKVGMQLFENAKINFASSIISSQDDDFMRSINEKYEGAGGQSPANPIQGFSESRKPNKGTSIGNFIGKFGTSIKEFFVQNVPIEDYSKSLLDLIQFTYFVEEWLQRVLQLKQQK